MKEIKKLDLQLFAGEGASGATGESGGQATSGENSAPVSPEQKLRELGVPESKLRNRANKYAAKQETVANTPQTTTNEQAAAATNTPEDKPTVTRMTWDEIMADPEYNKNMQAVVQSRLRDAKIAENNLAKLKPALEVIARKHNLDPAKLDYEALAKAVNDDDSYYEDKALEMGVSVETAKRIDKLERDEKRAQVTLQELKIREHFSKLEQQGEALKNVFPTFDLRQELKNPVFARLTSPNIGLSVEDAYYAVHRKEIQLASMQISAQKTAQRISNSIQAGNARPDESGTSSQAPSVTTFNYRNASPEQRNALKKRIREASARGEKLYPGQ